MYIIFFAEWLIQCYAWKFGAVKLKLNTKHDNMVNSYCFGLNALLLASC